MKIDRTQLYELFDHNEAMVSRFLDIFSTQTPIQMGNLRQAIEAGDFATATITAHGLKTQFRYVGLDDIAQLCQQIEKAPESDEVSSWLQQLEKVIADNL